MSKSNLPDDQRPDTPDSITYQIEYDCRTDSVSEELIRVVAALTDADPKALAPLADSIDPDALDAVFQPRFDGTVRDSNRRVEFDYSACHVIIESNDTITIHQPA